MLSRETERSLMWEGAADQECDAFKKRLIEIFRVHFIVFHLSICVDYDVMSNICHKVALT